MTHSAAEQHANPKSDIEIAQAGAMRPIIQVAGNKLGIETEHLEPYGHYKAKVSLDYVKSLEARHDGKLILVTHNLGITLAVWGG